MPRNSAFGLWLAALVLFMVSPWQAASAQEITSTPTSAAEMISSPKNDEVVAGILSITGTTTSAWSLDFAYADDPTGTWFSIFQSGSAVSAGVLANWDTNNLTDGLYVLRLRVIVDGAAQDYKVNVRVGNYSPTEVFTPVLTLTATPASSATIAPIVSASPAPALTVSAEPSVALPPQPVLLPSLPPNPVALDPRDITTTLGKAILAVFVIFAFTGLTLLLRRK
jgi:hypothetical protein